MFGVSSFYRNLEDKDDDPDYGYVSIKYETWDDKGTDYNTIVNFRNCTM